MVALRGEYHLLGAHRSDKATRGNPLKFDGLHCVGRSPGYSVHQSKGGVVTRGPTTNPISYLELVGVRCGVLGNVVYNDSSTCAVDDVGVHPEGWVAFPVPILQVPEIFNSGVANFGNGVPFIEAVYPKGVAGRVGDEKIIEDGLPEDLHARCWFNLHKAGPDVQPRVKDIFPKGVGHFFKFGGNEEPVYVRGPWPFAMHRELDLVRPVPQNFFPGFSPWG